jgi:hypothetical protein
VLVLVEGTKARVVPSGVAQFYTGLGDEVHDVYFGFDFIYG